MIAVWPSDRKVPISDSSSEGSSCWWHVWPISLIINCVYWQCQVFLGQAKTGEMLCPNYSHDHTCVGDGGKVTWRAIMMNGHTDFRWSLRLRSHGWGNSPGIGCWRRHWPPLNSGCWCPLSSVSSPCSSLGGVCRSVPAGCIPYTWHSWMCLSKLMMQSLIIHGTSTSCNMADGSISLGFWVSSSSQMPISTPWFFHCS